MIDKKWVDLIFILIIVGISLIFSSFMPDIVPLSLNDCGNIVRSGIKEEVIFFIPAVIIVIYSITTMAEINIDITLEEYRKKLRFYRRFFVIFLGLIQIYILINVIYKL